MKIKEMEQRTGIRSANIRYYEKMGLFVPKRDKESNYREYSEEDVEALNKIKILRLIGVPISEIQKLGAGERSMDAVITERLEQIEKEAQNLEDVKGICNTILKNHIRIEDLSESVLVGENKIWRKRLERIWKEDIDRRLLLKGTVLMLGVALFIAATKWTLMYGYEMIDALKEGISYAPAPDPMKETVLFYAGVFFLLYGFIWAIIEGHDDMPFLYCYSTKYWAAPGMGILTNSFSMTGLGVGIMFRNLMQFIVIWTAAWLVLVIVRSIIMYRHNRRQIL